MPSVLVSAEIVVGTLLVIILLGLAVTYLRRRYIAKGHPLTLCGHRAGPSDRWRLGHLRFGDNALEWYSLGGVTVRPQYRWTRQSLLLETPVPLIGEGAIPVLPSASVVSCREGDDAFELALQLTAYTALRSWQEAAPPGHNLNVA